MKNLIRLTDYKAKDVYEIFDIADEIIQGKYKDILNGKTVVLFFPNSSIRTRVTFEKEFGFWAGKPFYSRRIPWTRERIVRML